MLTIHHLGKSQSERILWLCEELGLTYELKHYARDPVTVLAPPDMQAMSPVGAAPFITDGDLLLAESGAIVDYILGKYAPGRLALGAAHPNFADYLYWFHFANGTLQPVLGRSMLVGRLKLPPDHPVAAFVSERFDRALGLVESRLATATWFAGDEFTAADIMMVFSLTTMRLFMPFDLAPFPHIRAYLQRVGARDAYQRAMRKGDPELTPLLS